MYKKLKKAKDKFKGKFLRGVSLMIKQIAWNTFKKTGNINTFLEYTQLKNIENDIIRIEENGNYKNERNNNS